MCESNVYLLKNGREEILVENVDSLKLSGDSIVLKSIFGEETTIDAAVVVEMHLSAHRIVLEQRGS